jgi:phytoene dehydrogenase-like protein
LSPDVVVVVVGAGLAGLCCAREVAAAGLTVRVLEAGDGVGGRVRTDVVDGYRLDRGFQILLTAYPEVAASLDVVALDLRVFDPGSLVWTGGGFDRVADPLRDPRAILSTLTAAIGSPLDKARVGLLRQRLVGTDPVDLLRRPDRSTADALRAAGFSTRMVDRFFRPLLGGIQLDLELATSARMYEVIFRTLAVGDAARAGHTGDPPTSWRRRCHRVWSRSVPVASIGTSAVSPTAAQHRAVVVTTEAGRHPGPARPRVQAGRRPVVSHPPNRR